MLASPLYVRLALPLVEQTVRDAEKLKPDAAADTLRMVAAVAAASPAADLAAASSDLYKSLRRGFAVADSASSAP